jgi:hypothetical protein
MMPQLYWKIGTASVLPLATLILVSGCSSRPARDLRGPDPEVGQVIRGKRKLTMTNGKITASAGGQTEEGQMEMTSDDADEEEILAVVNGEVTKSRTKVITQQSTEKITQGGKTDTHTTKNPLEGETVECEKVGKEWKKTLVGKVANDKQALELKMFAPPESNADWYPTEPVKPGHRWKVPTSKLRKLVPSDLEIEEGYCKRKFEKMVEVDGEQCAEIANDLAIIGKMKDEKGEWRRFEMKVSGTAQRSLQKGLTLTSNLKGTITISGTETVDGQKVEVKISGPVTIEQKWRRK